MQVIKFMIASLVGMNARGQVRSSESDPGGRGSCQGTTDVEVVSICERERARMRHEREKMGKKGA